MEKRTPLVFLACEVFKGVVCLPVSSEPRFLDAGLHATPKKLHNSVQEQIDVISEPSIIVLGYGLCGNGLNNIHAGKHTLIIPKMDDCIAMFMGGREVFREEFAKDSGTYYLTKGWLQAETHPLAEYHRHLQKYDKDIADYVMDQQYRHYHRLLFVAHSQADLDGYRPIALEVAEFCQRWDMQYEEYLGTEEFLSQLEKTLIAPEQTDEYFIIIQPGETLSQDMFL